MSFVSGPSQRTHAVRHRPDVRSYVVTPLIEYGARLSRHANAGVSASADDAGDGYARSYIGVGAPGASRSGLPLFAPRGGVKNATVGLLGNYAVRGDLLRCVSLFSTGSYSRLLYDFTRSSVVRIAGDRIQPAWRVTYSS